MLPDATGALVERHVCGSSQSLLSQRCSPGGPNQTTGFFLLALGLRAFEAPARLQALIYASDALITHLNHLVLHAASAWPGGQGGM